MCFIDALSPRKIEVKGARIVNLLGKESEGGRKALTEDARTRSERVMIWQAQNPDKVKEYRRRQNRVRNAKRLLAQLLMEQRHGTSQR